MDRTDLQQLAQDRLDDAKVLLQAGRYSGAYYLAGYAVECGLKACIARNIRQYEFPKSANFSKDIFTHALNDLVKHAGLTASRNNQIAWSQTFKLNWDVVQKWTVESRYEDWTQQEAQELLDAVDQQTYGVMQWIRQLW